MVSEEELFKSLVFTFHITAMQQLGKTADPMTGKTAKDLEQLLTTLEMLEMIKNKTKGNLSEEESFFLNKVYSNIKEKYNEQLLSEVNKPKFSVVDTPDKAD